MTIMIRVLVVFSLMIPAFAEQPCVCQSMRLSEASYEWNFPVEAEERLAQLAEDADKIQQAANILSIYAMKPEAISWGTYAAQLNLVAARASEARDNACRLGIIVRVVRPEQRQRIEQIEPMIAGLIESSSAVLAAIADTKVNRYTPEFLARLDDLQNRASQLHETLESPSGAATLAAR